MRTKLIIQNKHYKIILIPDNNEEMAILDLIATRDIAEIYQKQQPYGSYKTEYIQLTPIEKKEENGKTT